MTEQFYHVILYEYEGGAPHFRIYNCMDPLEAVLKLLAHNAASHERDDTGRIYMGDLGFRLICSSQLSSEELVIHDENDVIRIP